jgi:hypothetical protein
MPPPPPPRPTISSGSGSPQHHRQAAHNPHSGPRAPPLRPGTPAQQLRGKPGALPTTSPLTLHRRLRNLSPSQRGSAATPPGSPPSLWRLF